MATNEPQARTAQESLDSAVKEGRAVKVENPPAGALQAWTAMACDFVVANMFIRMTNNRVAPVKLYYEKINTGLEALRAIDELKHRTITEAITKTIGLIEQLIRDTPWYRIGLKAQLRAKLEGARVVEQIVLNTPPPAGWQIVKRPKEEKVRKLHPTA